jgi:hypothetical protein
MSKNDNIPVQWRDNPYSNGLSMTGLVRTYGNYGDLGWKN